MIKKNIVKNPFGFSLLIQTTIKIIATSIGIFTTAWLISESTVSSYANYTVIFGFVTLIQTTLVFGIPRIIQKTFTNLKDKKEQGKVWSALALLRLFSYFLGILFILIFISLTSIRDVNLTILIFSAQFIILTDEAFRGVCDARGETWKYSLTDFLEKFLFTIFLLLYSHTEFLNQIHPIWFFSMFSIFTRSLMLLADYTVQNHNIEWQKPSFKVFKQNQKAITYLTVTSIFIALVRGTQLILDFLGVSDNDLGIYFNANKLYMISLILPGMTVPMLASRVRKNLLENKLSFLGKKLKKYKISDTNSILIEWIVYTFLVGIVAFVLTSIFSPIGIFLIDSQSKFPFWSTVFLTVILLSGLILYFPNLLISNLMTLSHYESYEFLSTALTAILGILINLSLGYWFGVNGVAFGVSLTAILDICIRSFFFIKILKNGDLLSKQAS